MEVVNSHIIAFMIVLSMKPIKMEECNAMTSSSSKYVNFHEIQQYLWEYRNRLLNSCTFGRSMGLQEERLCFDHCTLRDNCIAVNTSSEGCQICYVDELSNDSSTFELGSSDIYVRRDNLGQLKNCITNCDSSNGECVFQRQRIKCLCDSGYGGTNCDVLCLTFDDGTEPERCYTRYGLGMTYFEAQEFCKEKGGYVIEINSAAEDEILSDFMIGVDFKYWIGAYEPTDGEGWFWNSTNANLNESYTNWAANDPTNPNEKCVARKKNTHWFDNSCDLANPVLCEYP